MRFSIKDSS